MRTPARRVVIAGIGTVLALAVSGCGGSDKTSSSPSSPAVASSPAASPAASSSAPAAGGGSETKLGAEICKQIKKVQGDVKAGSPGAAYVAQFALGLSGFIIETKGAELFREKGDDAAKSACPTEYASFLKQAGIPSLGGSI